MQPRLWGQKISEGGSEREREENRGALWILN